MTKQERGVRFIVNVAIFHWLTGLFCLTAGFGRDSWRFTVVGIASWFFAGMLIIALAIDANKED